MNKVKTTIIFRRVMEEQCPSCQWCSLPITDNTELYCNIDDSHFDRIKNKYNLIREDFRIETDPDSLFSIS